MISSIKVTALLLLLLLSATVIVQGFVVPSANTQSRTAPLHMTQEEKKSRGFWESLDEIIDDFVNKRMGKGEIFYGKRKYNPSGTVDGNYNGFGLSDKLKIEQTQEYKEMWLEEKKLKDEARKRAEENGFLG